MNEPAPPTHAPSSSTSFFNVMPTATVDVLTILRTHTPMIVFCGVVGMLLGTLYWSNAQTWFESTAKMLVTLKDMRSGDKGDSKWAAERVDDDVLANHMEIVTSRRIIGNALERVNWATLPGLVSHLKGDEDPIAYVTDNLSMSKGGSGSARTARSLNIKFRHTHPEETLIVLNSIVAEYEIFLDGQVNRVMTEANRLIAQAQEKIEQELKSLELAYVAGRKNAPAMYSGEGTSNVYLDKYRRLQDEMVTVEIERSAISTRLENVNRSIENIRLNHGDTLEMVALIDNDSLQRLGTFAGFSSAQTSEFQQTQASRAKEAEAKFNTLMKLQSDLSRMEANFGPSHPEVENLRRDILHAKNVISESERKTQYAPLFEKLTPELLMKAYTGFLRNDLAALDARKARLDLEALSSEEMSKTLIEFELKDKMILSEIERKQALFEGVVAQLRELDTAAGLSGYIHEVLEDPQVGLPVWPSLPICFAGGTLLGLLAGASLAVMIDQLDSRFRSPKEIDTALGIPVIAQVGRISPSRGQKRGARLIVDAQAPEAEAFRLVRTYLLRDVKSGKVRTAMVTSSRAQDGKSTILANLAASFSELGLKVLVIDGDMRAPTVHRFMNIPIGTGLSDVLQQQAKVEDVVRPSGIEGLSILTAGGAVRNPAELLQSESFENVLTECKQLFDIVLVDCGPVLLVSDPAIVSQKCDISLLVIRPSADPKTNVIEAVRRLRSAKSNLRGCILNTFGSSKEFTKDSGYGSSYYGYGYGNRVQEHRELDRKAQAASSGTRNENGHANPNQIIPK